jgi:ribonuclease BN (tRNA processing enzyme)
VLLDAGSGSVGQLQLAQDYRRLDAIVISHMHPDHFFDLVALRYGLRYGPSTRRDRVPLWLPRGGAQRLEALRGAVAADTPADFFDAVYTIREYDCAQALTVNDLRVRFCRTRHYVDAFAMRVESGDASLTYSADTAPCDAVVELAKDSGLFLCEASLGLGSEQGERGHTSAEEAGEMASRGRVGRLVLTHYPAEYPAEALVEAARRRYDGPVEAAYDGMEILL